MPSAPYLRGRIGVFRPNLGWGRDGTAMRPRFLSEYRVNLIGQAFTDLDDSSSSRFDDSL